MAEYKPYWEKLRDPRWQKKRLEILQRDEWCCTECGEKDATLHVHHGYYEKGREPWENDNETLFTLCDSCHEVAGEYQQVLQRTIGRCPPGWLLNIASSANDQIEAILVKMAAKKKPKGNSE